MTRYDRITLGRQAKALGFVRDTFEKVCRLADILRFFETDTLLAESLALKGGTAINLSIFNLPRLSVDIDLDFAKDISREAMLDARKGISERINKNMTAADYRLGLKSKQYHALDSFVYEYTNAGGMKDNLKIEINYMLRAHVLPVSRRQIYLPWQTGELTVLSVDPIEIFSSKIVALINRTAPRDLFDIFNMQRYGLFDESQEPMLRKCVVFYSAIAAENAPERFRFDGIQRLSAHQIKTELVPVLRRAEHFDLALAQESTMEYLSGLLVPEERELDFWQAFREKEYRPELLFDSVDVLDRITQHPMALWKCGGRESQTHDAPER